MNLESHIQADGPVIIYFFAKWCGSYTLMMPVMREIEKTIGERVTVLQIDIDKSPYYKTIYDIQSVPTLIIFKKGEIIWRKNGIAPAHEILSHLQMIIA